MRGYFGVGVERMSKSMNAGAIFRTAHAFGASFGFTINSTVEQYQRHSDTSDARNNMPYYNFETIGDLMLPKGCKLIGVELIDESIDLPSFHHPKQAAYVLGPERDSLSPELVERCDQVVKIPTKFCINVGLAAGIVMYDRTISLGRFPPRPFKEGMVPEPLPDHQHGGIFSRKPKLPG